MKNNKIATLFLDIGGVLLTNGWDRDARQKAVEKFGLDKEETDERHGLIFDTYEAGKMTLDDYLEHVIFYEKRDFTPEDFKTFMFRQSQPLKGALEYFKELKKQYSFKVLALNNEPRELNDYRIEKYKLNELFDFYVTSWIVKMRKPDPDMYRLACDISRTPPDEALYIDDRLTLVEVAKKLGVPGLHYQGIDSAKEYFGKMKIKKN